MRLLILGGTKFLGRATAAHALAAGHEVTCAARGTSGTVAEGARLVRVDRSEPGALAALDGTFDAVIDVSSTPSHIRAALAGLAGRTGHWTFVSTASVYADAATPGQRAETALTLPPAPPDLDDPAADAEAYGRCKVSGEQAVLAAGGPA